MKIIVLGAGLVGAPMAEDLAKDPGFSVTTADISDTVLKRLEKNDRIETVRADLSDREALRRLIADKDIVLNAVPGFMGYSTLETIIETGKDVIDIAFFPEDALTLDDLAKEKGVKAVVDCGVAPGMSNVLVGYADQQLNTCDSALIYVGGLPEKREWPWDYKAVFSPVDVIEEYIRPAYYVENHHTVCRPALSDPEYVTFPEIGTLEAFNTDGLRTMAKTLDIPNMKEKTLRYPGHIEKIKVLRETGFFSQEPIEVNGTKIRPIDFTGKVLFPKWQLKEGEIDLTIMKVEVTGEKDGKPVQYVYDLFDKYDPDTGVHSMARTTGYTATVALRMLAEGLFDRVGVSPPEFIGKKPECVDFMLKGLKDRGVVYRETLC
jgi:saccharopine dehydrogenase-like NADP-dependent oxidoreductase